MTDFVQCPSCLTLDSELQWVSNDEVACRHCSARFKPPVPELPREAMVRPDGTAARSARPFGCTTATKKSPLAPLGIFTAALAVTLSVGGMLLWVWASRDRAPRRAAEKVATVLPVRDVTSQPPAPGPEVDPQGRRDKSTREAVEGYHKAFKTGRKQVMDQIVADAGECSVTALRHLLDDGTGDERWIAAIFAEAMGEVARPLREELLRDLSDQSNGRCRVHCAGALLAQRHETAKAQSVLADCLRSAKRSEIRVAAAHYLKKYASLATRSLAAQLQDSILRGALTSDVAELAVDTLLASPEAVTQTLVPGLCDAVQTPGADTRTRQRALDLLGRMGRVATGALPVLEVLARQSADDPLARNVKEAYRLIAGGPLPDAPAARVAKAPVSRPVVNVPPKRDGPKTAAEAESEKDIQMPPAFDVAKPDTVEVWAEKRVKWINERLDAIRLYRGRFTDEEVRQRVDKVLWQVRQEARPLIGNKETGWQFRAVHPEDTWNDDPPHLTVLIEQLIDGVRQEHLFLEPDLSAIEGLVDEEGYGRNRRLIAKIPVSRDQQEFVRQLQHGQKVPFTAFVTGVKFHSGEDRNGVKRVYSIVLVLEKIALKMD